MPRLTNPGDISTGPGKTASTDTDQLVLDNVAGGIGDGAYVPRGGSTPREGYPALPCRACGGVTTGSAVSVEETILTVGLPNVNPAWTDFVPDFPTLADAVDAANTLMAPDGGNNPGRAVRILVVGPTIETAVPIQIDVDGLIIEGTPSLRGTDSAITWVANTALIDLNGHEGLVFRDLDFEWNGVLAPPGVIPDRVLFHNSSVTKVIRLTIDNCQCLGDVQGFLSNAVGVGSAGGFEFASITRNYAPDLLEFGILSTTTGGLAPFVASNITENTFLNSTASTFFFPAIGFVGLATPSNTLSIRNNNINGFYSGISSGGALFLTGTTEVISNIIEGTEAEGIIIRGTANRVEGNTLLSVFTSGGLKNGIFVDGDDNVVRANHVTTSGPVAADPAIWIGSTGENNVCSQNDLSEDDSGYLRVVGAHSVVTENKCKRIQSEGVNSTVSLNIVLEHLTDLDVNIKGAETTVQGNSIAEDLVIQTSRCTVVGNQVAGNLLVTNEGHDNTIGDNYVGIDIAFSAGSRNMTVSGNYIERNFSEVTGCNTFTGNHVKGTVLTIGDECVVDSNRLVGLVRIQGDKSVFTGNKCNFLIQIDGDSCTVSGNYTDTNITVLDGKQVTITGNIVTINIFVTINAIDCVLTGNRVVGDIDVLAIDCVLTGNSVNALTAGGGAAPVGTLYVGNKIKAALGEFGGAPVGPNPTGNIP